MNAGNVERATTSPSSGAHVPPQPWAKKSQGELDAEFAKGVAFNLRLLCCTLWAYGSGKVLLTQIFGVTVGSRYLQYQVANQKLCLTLLAGVPEAESLRNPKHASAPPRDPSGSGLLRY